MAIAALVYPAVEWLAHFRFVPRGVAVLLTALVLLGAIGFVGYKIVNDVSDAMSSLQQAAPQRAARARAELRVLPRDQAARSASRISSTRFPQRLAGGEAPEAIKSAATQGVAFLAGLHPHDLLRALRDAAHRRRPRARSTTTSARRRAEFVIRDGSRAGTVLRAREALGGGRRGGARVRDRARGRRARRRPRSRCGSGCGASCRSRAWSSARCRSSSSRARTRSTRAVVVGGVLRRDPDRRLVGQPLARTAHACTSARSRSCSPRSAGSSSTA